LSRIGFIGLGIMGSPMAANLVRAGHQVTGHDHKQSSMDRLAAAGGQAAATIADAVADAEVVAQLIAAARAQGYGALDHSALLEVIETLSGQARAGQAGSGSGDV